MPLYMLYLNLDMANLEDLYKHHKGHKVEFE